ncbi:MAG: dephospho-CoA kinase [Candidatus Cloacimonadales bacterium]
MSRPLIIGITGSIASGKSELVKLLQQQNFKIHSTDLLGHGVLNLFTVKQRLVEEFGGDIVINNQVDRTKLGNAVFGNPRKLKLLNSITHPYILLMMKELVSNCTEKQIFFEVPLLFEANLESHFDYIITVSTTKDIQLKRLMARNKLDEEQAMLKINSQLPNYVKEVKANYIINNDGAIEDLQPQVKELLDNLKTLRHKEVTPF